METCPCSSLYFFETIVTGGISIQMSSSLNPVAFYTVFRPVAYFRHSSSRPHIPFLPACGKGGFFRCKSLPRALCLALSGDPPMAHVGHLTPPADWWVLQMYLPVCLFSALIRSGGITACFVQPWRQRVPHLSTHTHTPHLPILPTLVCHLLRLGKCIEITVGNDVTAHSVLIYIHSMDQPKSGPIKGRNKKDFIHFEASWKLLRQSCLYKEAKAAFLSQTHKENNAFYTNREKLVRLFGHIINKHRTVGEREAATHHGSQPVMRSGLRAQAIQNCETGLNPCSGQGNIVLVASICLVVK